MTDFKNVMAERTDEQLLNILTRSRADYHPEAITAAEAEFARRGLSAARIHEIQNEIERATDRATINAEKPLFIIWKFLALLCPGVLLLFAALILKVEGYERQYRELKRWTLYGVGFYFILVLLIEILNS